jgi:uncharacterized protein (TIGR02300 family)
MTQEDLGQRRVCQTCQGRFYDLKRKPIVCPKCQAVFEPTAPHKPKRSRASTKESQPKAFLEGFEDIDLETEEILPGEDVLIEDPDDLGDADDVVGGLDPHTDPE